jgi:hypothetical protein
VCCNKRCYINVDDLFPQGDGSCEKCCEDFQVFGLWTKGQILEPWTYVSKLGMINLNLWANHFNDVENVFHYHLIVIKVTYYEFHNVQKDKVLVKFLLDTHHLHLQWGVVTLTSTINSHNHYLIFWILDCKTNIYILKCCFEYVMYIS